MSENHDIKNEQSNFQDETLEGNNEIMAEVQPEEKTTEDLLSEERDRYIRLYAEFENFKKRTAKERNETIQFANQNMMVTMLGVLDDFERAIKEIGKNGNSADLQGVELIYQKFKTKLFEKGLTAIEVNPGDVFDVQLHEAITQIPAPTDDLKDKVVDVIETGYLLYGKVIRFAKVVVGY